MTVTDTMVNGLGIAHGGYLFLLADAAFSFAANTYEPVAVAQAAHVMFLSPATSWLRRRPSGYGVACPGSTT